MPYRSVSSREEIVFILGNLPDIQQLVEGINSGKEVYILDPHQDGLAQMADILAGRSGIDAIHLLSHGIAGEVLLGTVTLNSGTVNDYAGVLAQISAALSPTGDLLLYGCNVAAGGEGQLLVDTLARLTLADVAASDDLTGAAALGGDWVLEYQSGTVESALPFADGVLVGYGDTLVNEEPVLNSSKSPILADVNENAAAPTNGSTIGSVLISDLVNTTPLANYSDANSDPAGVAITGVNHGTLYFSINSGTAWTELTGTVGENSALLLKADMDTRLYFKPATHYTGTISDAVTFKAWDQTGGYANGQTGVATKAGTSLSLAATLTTGQIAWGVAVSGNYAYVAANSFQVINISNPASPTLTLGGLAPINQAVGIVVDGNYAYVAEYTQGLRVINIINPVSPTLAGTCDTSGVAYGVTVSGSYAYVADGESGLQVINISTPTNPTLVGTYNTSGDARGVAVSGNYAYVADNTSGLQVINISDPANPTFAGTLGMSGTYVWAMGVEVSGSYAYVATNAGGLWVVNISNPAIPTLVKTLDTSGNAYGVVVSNGYAYIADGPSGLHVIDVSNPASPILAGTIDTTGEHARGIAVSGGYAYVADWSSGLQVIQVTNIPLTTAVSTASDTVSVYVNAAPTLTTISNVTGGTEDTQQAITFTTLAGLANEADNGTVEAFVVKAVSTGTLRIGAEADSATAWDATTNAVVDSTHNAYWTPASNANGTLNAFTVVAQDNGGAESTSPVQVVVETAAVNDAPTITGLPRTITVTEDVASNVDLSAVTLSDVDSTGSTFTLVIVAGAGTLAAVTADDVTVSGSNTATLTLTGTASNIDTFLNTASHIQYTGVLNANGDNATTLTLTASDHDGSSDVLFGTVNVDITAVNDAPTIALADSLIHYTERYAAVQIDAAAALHDVDGDADWNGGKLEVQITSGSVASDTITLADSDVDGTTITVSGTDILANGTDVGDLSASAGTVTGSTKLTITFDSDATNTIVQEVLQSLRYLNNGNDHSNTPRVVIVTATDKAGDFASDTRTTTVTPLLYTPTLFTLEDTEVLVSGVFLTYAVDPTSSILYHIVTTAGKASIKTLGSASIISGTNGSADFTISGTLTAVNSALATLSYTPTLNQNSSTLWFSPKIELTANGDDYPSFVVWNLAVTAVNDAPYLESKINLTVAEGGNSVFSLAQLATSASVLDPDIGTGQQVLVQQMMTIKTLPTQGTLTYKDGVVDVDSVIPVSDLANLKYIHSGADVSTTATDSFDVAVSDGGGAKTTGTLSVTITPVNVAPSISGSPSIVEGQVKVVAPTINLGDSFDTLANSTIVISSVSNGGQGTLFLDADADNVVDTGEALSTAENTTLTAIQRTNLSTQLKFLQDGTEPNAPSGVSAPKYTITVTDAGGGQGDASAKTLLKTITLTVVLNNDQPVVVHITPPVSVVERSETLITTAMLQVTDYDLNPANPNELWPTANLVYTIVDRPTYGQVLLQVSSGVWKSLDTGGRFTQADIAGGKVKYYQSAGISVPTLEKFTFAVRDSSYGYELPTPDNLGSIVFGAVRVGDVASGAIRTLEFGFNLIPASGGDGGGGTAPTYDAMTYNFGKVGTNCNGTGSGWDEGNSTATGVITQSMLEYKITRTFDTTTLELPAAETVYTLSALPTNGVVQRNTGTEATPVWQSIGINSQFTQADIKSSKIRFLHNGDEDFINSFGFTVSDGTEGGSLSNTFTINVAPLNDRPTVNGGSAEVKEGNGNIVRLGAGVLGMSDADGATDLEGEGTNALWNSQGLEDFLWFRITSLPVDGGGSSRGTLQRWDGDSWEAVVTDTWLPSTLLTATNVDGKTSGFRYVHDGSEPLAYSGGAKVMFNYIVRDDLANPGNPFTTDTTTAVPDTSGSAQSNQSGTATAKINIVPVNNAPQIANIPGDTEPTITGTITDGGLLGGHNDILVNVPQGGTLTITSAFLTAIDSDNTTVQRQFYVTSVPTLGVLQLSGKTLGMGSTFTQNDIDQGHLAYTHNDSFVGTLTADALGSYHDAFHFVVDDGVAIDTGASSPNYNSFLITISPLNNAPTLTAPTGTVPILLYSTTAANNPVTGFVVADPDITDGVTTGETDFVQATVRILDSLGAPISSYTDVNFGYATPTDVTGLWKATGGTGGILQLQGTVAQVNAALAGLNVTFGNTVNGDYQVQVIVDDRMRDANGALTNGADGGYWNEAATAGDPATAVPSTVYTWSSAAIPANDPNITANTVAIRVSCSNEVPIFTAPATATVNEDDRTLITTGSFVVADPESAKFNTPVKVTLSVGSGTLDVAGVGAQTSFTPNGGQAITIAGDTTATVILTGRAGDIQALLNQKNFLNTAADTNGGVFYTSAGNVNHDTNDAAAGDVTLTLSFDDTDSRFGSDVGSGSVAANPSNITTALTITPINDAISISNTATLVTVNSTSATAVTGFVIADVDDTDGGALGATTGETDVVQATVRLLNNSGAPLAAVDYTGYGVVLSSSASEHGATVDSALSGNNTALEVRGTLAQVNAYLAGLQVALSSDPDNSYSIEVIADDRLRNLTTGVLTSGASGGANNQQTVLPSVPTTDTFDPYSTTVSAYNLYDVVSNTRSLFVSSINDPANITATNVEVNEGSATLVLNASNSNFTIADSDDNGADNLSATVTVNTGTITAVGGAGGSVSDTGTATVTITGVTEAQLNSRFQALTLTYPDFTGTPTSADWNGQLTVTVVYNDNGNTGTRPTTLEGDSNDSTSTNGDYAYMDAGNALTTTRTITVTVANVNDAPTRTDATAVTLADVSEDVAGGTGVMPPGDTVANLFGIKFSDALDAIGGTGGSSANTFAGVAITTNAAITSQGVWQYSTDHNTWTTLPTVSTVSALLLNTSDYLRFVPATNYFGTPGSLIARLVDSSGEAFTTGTTVNVSNDTSLSGGSTRYSNSSNVVTLNTTVANINDRPTATDTTLTATTEDATNPVGATVAALGFGYSDATDNQGANTGNAFENPGAAITGGGEAATPFGGIAIVANNANATTEGVWQYKDNVGGDWLSLPNTIASGTEADNHHAFVIPTSYSLRFLPNVPNYNGTPGSLTVRVADTAQTFSADSDIDATINDQTSIWSYNEVPTTLGTTVSPQNDAPMVTATLANPFVTENATTGGTSIDPVNLLTSASVGDLDFTTASFGGGKITVNLTAYSSGDVLDLPSSVIVASNAVQVSGTDVQYSSDGSTWTSVGTIDTTYTGLGKDLVINLKAAATEVNLGYVLEALRYRSTSDNPTVTSATRNYSITINDGNNNALAGGPGALDSSPALTGTITITPQNDAPVLTDLTAVTFAENTVNATAQIIDSAVTFTDPDSPDFIGGSLTVSYSAAGLVEDQLSIKNQGTATGQISVSGTTVSYQSKPIGTISTDGSNGLNLVVNFNTADATPTAVDALIQALTYKNTSDTPTATRTISITVSDGDGGTSTAATSFITVTPENDPPDLTATVGGSYAEGAATALQFLSSATVTDPDTTHFNGGSLMVAFGSYVAGDTLSIVEGNLITLSGSTVNYNGNAIGTYSGGSGANLVITFTSVNATYAAVVALTQHIGFSSSSDNPTASGTANTRSVTVTLNDGGNSGSGVPLPLNDTTLVTGTINVAGVNDQPTLTDLDATAATTHIQGGAAVVLDADAALADLDLQALNSGTGNWSGSTLTIQRHTTASADDLFGGSGNLAALSAASGNVVLSSTTIGTYTQSSGVLTITFNASATTAKVNEVLHSFTYSNTQTTPNSLSYNNVSLDVTFNDLNSNGTEESGQDQGTGGKLDVTRNITVNINRLPMVVADTNSVAEDSTSTLGNVLTGVGNTGNLGADSDADIGVPRIDALVVVNAKDSSDGSYTVVNSGTTCTDGTSITGDYGSLKIGADGSYTYTVNNASSAVQALAVNESLTDTFTYQVHDGVGGYNAANLTETITGTNDAPNILTGSGDTVQLTTGTSQPTFRLSIPTNGVVAGNTVRLTYLGQSQAGQAITADDIAHGYVDVALTEGIALKDVTTSLDTVPVKWIDWTTSTSTTASGIITTEGGMVTATLSSSSDLAGVQTSTDTNFWVPTTPYISTGVAAPTTSDIVRFSTLGDRILTFSSEVRNLYFGFISMNGNGYRFDRDFDILSQAISNQGYWGLGEAQKREVVINGVTYYELYAVSGEPHGVIRFKGAFSTLTWNNPTTEFWHGFTVGIKSTSTDLQNVKGEFLHNTAVIATSPTTLVTYDALLTGATGTLDTTVSSVRLTETDVPLSGLGSLTLYDVDTSDVVAVHVDSVAISGVQTGLALDNSQVLALLNATSTDTSLLQSSKINWSFNSSTENFNWLAAGEELTFTYALTVNDSNGGTDSSKVTVVIVGTNDSPILIPVVVAGAITEGSGALTCSGSASFTDADLSDTFTARILNDSVVWSGGTLSAGQKTTLENGFSINATTFADPATITCSYTNTEPNLDFIAAGQTVTLKYYIELKDSNNKAVSTPVTITITGTNDDPTITLGTGDGATAAITETNTTLTASDTLTITDVDITNTVAATVPTVAIVSGGRDNGITNATLLSMLTVSPANVIGNAATTGSLTWAFNSGSEYFDYLEKNETLVLNYTVRVTDSSGATANQTVQVTITGTNDLPTLTIAAPSSVAELDNASTQDLSAITGSLVIADKDVSNTLTPTQGAPTVVWSGGNLSTAGYDVSALTAANVLTLGAAGTSNGGNVNISWSYDPAGVNLDFLAAAQTLTITYPVTITDEAAITSNKNLVITITGTNDAPIITVESGDKALETLAESDAGLSTTGTLSVMDLDYTNTVSAQVFSVSKSGTIVGIVPTDATLKGYLSLTSSSIIDATNTSGDIVWNFSSGNEAFNYLAAGESLVLTYTVRATDSNSTPATADQTVTITITGTNDAPTLTGLNASTYTENASPTLIDSIVSFADPDTSTMLDGGSLTVSITANGIATDQLCVLNQGNASGEIGVTGTVVSYGGTEIGTIITNGVNGTNLVISFNASATPTAVDALIQRIAYSSTSENPTQYQNTRTLSFTINDGDGTDNGGTNSVTQNSLLTITPLNDAPSVTLPTIPDLPENTSQPINGISIADPDSGAVAEAATTTLKLRVTKGTLSFTTTSSGSASVLSGNNTTEVTFQGKVADINALLAINDNFRYHSDTDFSGYEYLYATVNDHGNVGTGGVGDVITSKGFTVTGINNPPVLTAPATFVIAEDSSASIVGDFTLTDPDISGWNMQLNVSVSHGILTFSDTTSLLFVDGTSNGAATLHIRAPLYFINAALDALNYTPTANYHGTDVLTLAVHDLGTESPSTGQGTVDGNPASAKINNIVTQSVAITVDPVNDQPTVSNSGTPISIAVTEDIITSGATFVSLLDSRYADPTDNQTASGGNTTATALSYVAITGNAATANQGTWKILQADNTTWITIPVASKTALSDTAAILVFADAKLYFEPATNFHGTPGTLTVCVADGSATLTTSTSADTGQLKNLNATVSGDFDLSTGSWAVNALTLTAPVSNVNDRPTASATTLAATAENTAEPAGALVSALGFGYNDHTDNQGANTVNAYENNGANITGGGEAATAFGGIAIVGNEANATTEGVWQYHLNSGGSWVDIGTLTDTTALILPTTASLRFVPKGDSNSDGNFDFNGTPGVLTVRVADSAQAFSASINISATLSDQTSTWSTATTLTTSVIAVNDAPVITLVATSANTFTEGIDTASDRSVLGAAVVIDGSVQIADADITLTEDTFEGSTLTVARSDGSNGFSANVDDLFGFSTAGSVTISGTLASGTVSVSSVVVGSYSYSNGTLTITFGNVTNAQVNAVAQAITYANSSDTPPTNVNLRYRFNDDNQLSAQGSGGVLTGDDVITVNISVQNDMPLAIDDTHQVAENVESISGNVKSGIGSPNTTADSDPENDSLSVSAIRTGTEVSGSGTDGTVGASLNGRYGSLVIAAGGSYTYTLDNSNANVNKLKTGSSLTDVFTYTISDNGTGTLSDAAQLTITINGTTDGTPTITAVDGNDTATGDATVTEAGLVDAGSTAETVTGTVTIAALDCLTSIRVGGTTVTRDALLALSTTNVVIDTGEGTLTLTNYASTSSVGNITTGGTLSYSYTLKARLPHIGATASESTDVITLAITDEGNATTNSNSLVIRIVDDVPTAYADAGSVTEGTDGHDAATLTGNVVANGTADDAADRLGADVPTNPVIAIIHGATTPTTEVTAGSTSSSNGTVVAGSYGSLTIGADGSYSYDLDDANVTVNALKAGGTLSDVFTYKITDADGDTSSATLTVTINGVTDGAPTITAVDGNGAETTGHVTVTEAGLVDAGSSAETTTGTITITATDGLQTVTIGGTTFTVAQLNGFTTQVPSTGIDTGEGTLQITGFTNTTGAASAPTAGTLHYSYTLKARLEHTGATASESTDPIAISITDKGGATVTGSDLIIRIVDDEPTVNADAHSVAEGTSTTATTTSGNVVSGSTNGDVADRVGADTTATPVTAISFGGNAKTVGTSFDSAYGSLTINSDGSYMYSVNNTNAAVTALNASQSLTETFVYTITDADGDSQSANLVITITGTNDAPTITAGSTTATGSFTETAATTGSTTLRELNGSIAFADVEIGDTHTASVTATNYVWSGGTLSAAQQTALTNAFTLGTKNESDGSGIQAWQFSTTDSTVDFLAAGQTLTATYTVTVTDRSGAVNNSCTQNVVVTITGTNDVPVIGAGTFAGNVTEITDLQAGENSSNLTVSNSFAVTDVDLTNAQSVAAVAVGDDYLGTFTPSVSNQTTSDGPGTISWSFTVADSAVDYLAAGQTLTQTYTVTVTDTAGATASHDVVVTITGTNDAPVIGAGTFAGSVT